MPWQQVAELFEANEKSSSDAFLSPFETFDFDECKIPQSELTTAGAGKDDIAALTMPKMISVADANQLHGSDRVVGLVVEGEPRAYPLLILERHEVVNDELGDKQFVVTYCPLCDSAVVMNRRVGGRTLEFGVSGLLYKSNLLLYDRTTESLWTQIGAASVSGEYAGTSLSLLPFEVTTWSEWVNRHPTTKVLSFQTGHELSYMFSPYDKYRREGQVQFPVEPQSNQFTPLTPMLGLRSANHVLAYRIEDFAKVEGDQTITRKLGKDQVTLKYDSEARSLRVVEASPGVESVYTYWFAWYSFHPDTEIGVPPGT